MSSAAPTSGPVKFDGELLAAIPGELRSRSQWVAWWSVRGYGKTVELPSGAFTQPLKDQPKPHKLPINPKTGALAASTRAASWANFDVAVEAVRKWSLTGVGLVFTDSDPYAGVDIDNCRDSGTGKIADWAWQVIRELNSYTEVSPSGTGVHIIIRGGLPVGRGNQVALNGGKVEMFSRARYFTFTGECVDNTPTEIAERSSELLGLHSKLFAKSAAVSRQDVQPAREVIGDDRELLEKARNAKNGLTFGLLWDGNWQVRYPSQSEADLALCCLLSFWSGRNATRIDSLFRQSGLMRQKWDSHNYRERTIKAATETTSEIHKPGRLSIPNGPKLSSSPRKNPENIEAEYAPCPDLIPFAYTDTGNAERLVRLYGSDMRFCAEMKKWLVWDGKRWKSEDVRRIKQLFKKTMREMYRQAADIAEADKREKAEKHARKSEAAIQIAAALSCAEYEEGICVSINELDSHPFLLNCKNGTLDLRSGELRQHDRRDLITKIVSFDYRVDASCPRFLDFLHGIMGGSPQAEHRERAARLVDYLQRCFGYALSADVSEKAIFCFFGSGDNGKTTLLETIRFILREYSVQILIDSLMERKSGESSTSLADLADLRGARFVTTSEAEKGQKFAAAKLKYLTQGSGEIRACRKYENPITFTVTHKLFVDANDKPLVRGGERALWNRLKPVPFSVKIPANQIDRTLLDKLKAEAEGVLAWMVEGSLRRLRDGLGDPPEVTGASAEWQAESDRFPAFLIEHYVVHAAGWVPVSEPWVKYTVWAEQNREDNRLSKPAFDQKLEQVGCKRGVRADGTVRAWIGIRLRTAEDEDLPPSDKVTWSDSKS